MMSDSPKFMDKLLDDVADKVTDGSGGNTKSSQIIKTEAVNEDISHKSSEDAYFTPLNALAVAALYMEPYEEKKDEPNANDTKVTLKKRGAVDNDEDSEQPKKKRSPSKAKNGPIESVDSNNSPKVNKKHSRAKAKDNVAENMEGGGIPKLNRKLAPTEEKPAMNDTKNGDDSGNKKNVSTLVEGKDIKTEAMEGVRTSTAKKSARAKPKAKSNRVEETDTEDVGPGASQNISADVVTNDDENILNDGESPKRKRNAPKQAITPARSIPTSWAMADEADRTLVTMRDEAKPWDEIRKAWEALTGHSVGGSTLPNRYSRIKDNLEYLREGDEERLLAAKDAIEAEFHAEKYKKILDAVVKAGGYSYSVRFVQKALKGLETGEDVGDIKAKGKAVKTAAEED